MTETPPTAAADQTETGELGHEPAQPTALDVYWRPGCGFCSRLFRSLDRAGVRVRRINIWEDDDARRFVRSHNRGNETVPTVDLAGRVRTNPQPDALIDEIRTQHPDLLGAGADADTPGGGRGGWWSRRQH